MPNRMGRQIPVADYAPHGLLPDGLLPVARPDGSVAAGLAGAADQLANVSGRYADEAAAIEGDRAGKTAGLDPNFRPKGETTLRGRAFEAAAVQTYQDNLDASLRTDMQAIFEQHKNNPTELTKAFDALGQTYRQQHVFKEIEGSFNASYARLRLPYQNKALSNLEADQKDRAKGKLIENITASQTNAARVAVLNPLDPATADVVNAELKRIDAMYDEAVSKDLITATQAASLKISNRNSMTQRAALAQAGSLSSADDVGTYRANVRKAFAAGKLTNLSAEGFDDLDSKLEAIQKAKRTEASAGETLLGKNVNDYVKRAADGLSPPADEWTRFAASDAAKTPKGQQILDSGQKKLQVASILRNRSVEDGETLLAQMRQSLAAGGGANSAQAELVAFADDFVKEQRSALKTDQLGLAAKKQIIPAVAPIDFQSFAASNDPNATASLAVQLRNRVAQATAVGKTFQRAPQFLRPEEKARLTDIVSQGGDKALALAGAIVRGADKDAPNVLREISDEAPLLAQAGIIIANGGSLQGARDAFEAARIKRDTGKDLPPIPHAVDGRIVRDEFGAAFNRQIGAQPQIIATAEAMTKVRVARAGLDPASSEAETIYKRSLQEAAGATFMDGVQYGGVANYRPGNWSTYKVPVPAGVRADKFRDVIGALRDDDLAALPVPPMSPPDRANYSARDLRAAVPVAVRGGYRFAMNDPSSDDPKFIRGSDGSPFVLPFDQLEPALRARVPGAFLGGR